jgi:chromosome segregation ATPase
MTFPLTREQALAAATSAAAERDTIQANILELDGSFGKRLLAGAALTGQSRDSWQKTAAALAGLWDTFAAYSAVIDRASEILNQAGRIPAQRVSEAVSLLTGPSVRLTRAVAPLSQRELTSGGQTQLTLQATVREMRSSFSEVAAVLTAAENVWNEISEGIRQITTDLEVAKRQLPGLDSAGGSGGSSPRASTAELAGALTQAENSLRELREQLNSDPLTFWTGGQVDTSKLNRVRQETGAAVAQVNELARVRQDADLRLSQIAAAVAAAQQAWQDATVAQKRAADRIAAPPAPPLPDVSWLVRRMGGLTELKTAGRWTRLASELDAIDKQADNITKRCREAEQAATGLVEQRDQLRGLLDAYRAKAGATGAAENADLDQRYQQAKSLLWTAPCDLAAATAAVNGYQQAILQLRRSGDRS